MIYVFGSMTWKDQSTGKSYEISGNDKTAYAQAAAEIRSQINAGHTVDDNALDILNRAKSIGIDY